MPSSSGSSRPRDWTRISCVSCIGKWVLYHWRHLEGPLTVHQQLGVQNPQPRHTVGPQQATHQVNIHHNLAMFLPPSLCLCMFPHLPKPHTPLPNPIWAQHIVGAYGIHGR